MSDACQTTNPNYTNAFLAATPEIAAEIKDYTVRTPAWLSDIYDLQEWTSNQNVMQELTFRGSMPEIERGFDKWKQLSAAAGCAPCLTDCSYNWTTFGGNAMERRMIQLMRREFKTQSYCVNEIKSTHDYEKVFAKIIENIQQQVLFFKEHSIGMNFLTGIAKKLIADSGGLKGNPQDPYVYRPIGAVQLSRLNRRLLTKVYEGMRRRTDVLPFDYQEGRPIYALSASDELIDDLFMNDSTSRQDLRFSSASDAVLTKYNFMSSIFGMFINAPLLYPRRFNIISGTWVEVFPFINDLPLEVGVFTDLNPAWESAVYEEVLIYGQKPFKVFYRQQVDTLGSGTNFGPEPTMLDTWQWINPQTDCDAFRRQGFFASSTEIALSAEYSGGVYGLMVPRPPAALDASFYEQPVCPVATVVPCATNIVAAVGCPCPLVTSAIPNPVTPGDYFITFAVPVTGVVGGAIQLGVASGGFITGELVAIANGGLTVEVLFEGIVIDDCNKFTTVFCTNTLACTSQVTSTCDCRAGETGQFKLFLAQPIKAVTVGNDIIGYMGDGTQQVLNVAAVDLQHNIWYVNYAPGSGPTDNPTGAGDPITLEAGVNCDRNGVVFVCVPPTTDASCPACNQSPVIPCAED